MKDTSLQPRQRDAHRRTKRRGEGSDDLRASEEAHAAAETTPPGHGGGTKLSAVRAVHAEKRGRTRIGGVAKDRGS